MSPDTINETPQTHTHTLMQFFPRTLGVFTFIVSTVHTYPKKGGIEPPLGDGSR